MILQVNIEKIRTGCTKEQVMDSRSKLIRIVDTESTNRDSKEYSQGCKERYWKRDC